jgi:hypothetical protein
VFEIGVEVNGHNRERVKPCSENIPKLRRGDLYMSSFCVREIADNIPPFADIFSVKQSVEVLCLSSPDTRRLDERG